MDDAALLAAFARENSQEAFQELVRRHIGVVYSVCLRQLRHAHWAEDVTQAVFIILAKKAPSLPPNVILGGWLYKTAVFACNNARDLKRTRDFHESQVSQMPNHAPPHDPAERAETERLLDAALMELSSAQREVLLLRYFQNKSLHEVAKFRGQTLYATQKSLDAGLAKLRRFLAQRGVSVSAALVVALLAEQSVKAAPAGLAATVGAAALASHSALSAPVAQLVSHLLRHGARAKFLATLTGTAACLLLGLAGITWAHPWAPARSLPPAAVTPIASLPTPEQLAPLWDTLRQADRALRTMDTASLDQLVSFSDPRQRRDWEAIAALFQADLALKQVASTRFGPDALGLTPIKSFANRLDEVLPLVDAAQCQWDLAPRYAALHFVYTSGAPGGSILFVHTGDRWKIDVTQTLDISLEGLDDAGRRTPIDTLSDSRQAHLWEKMALLARSFSRVRDRITSRQLLTLSDTRADLLSDNPLDDRAFFHIALRLDHRQELRSLAANDAGRVLP